MNHSFIVQYDVFVLYITKQENLLSVQGIKVEA